MKKIFLTIVIALLFCLTSCSEKYLEVPMYGATTDGVYYKNLQDFQHALATNYYFLKKTWNELNNKLLFINDVASDDCDKGGQDANDNSAWYQLETFNIFTTNGEIANFWKMAYQAIYQCNLLLDKAVEYRAAHTDLSESDNVTLTQYENETRWIRGLWYFHLAYLWKDVPLFLHAEAPDNVFKPRVPVDSVWMQVISDFTAATNLPKRSEYSANDMGRVTSGAAYAMLGRTHWFRRNFVEAKNALAILVTGEQGGEYVLDNDFATQWLNRNSNVRESIFEIQYKSSGKGWEHSTGWNGVWFIPSCDGGYGFHLPTQDLLNEFDADDPRITWTFIKQGDKFVGNSYVTAQSNHPNRYFDRKHFVPQSETLNANPPVYSQDLTMTNYIIRYADVLLMYAESCLETGDAGNACYYLNKVRERARNSSPLDEKRSIQKIIPATTATSLPDVETTDLVVLRNAIWHERRCELACEGLRRMDLIQQQRYGQVMTAYHANTSITKDTPDKGAYYQQSRELFPIPQNERDLSHQILTQNEGY